VTQKIVLLFLLLPITSFAVPIDWHGVFGVDTTLIDNYRRVQSKVDNSATANAGSQEVALGSGAHANASFQSYLFRLNPTMIINDAATFKGEITSGYGRGGRLGDNSTQTANSTDGMGTALYMHNAPAGDDLVLNKMYVELYSDTATYVIGRHTAHWGLGVLVNSGDDTWDRHTFIRDGITLKFKIGNFKIEPYWSKVSSTGSLTRASKIKEYGFSLLYDNNDSDLALGLLFGKKANSKFNTTITRDGTNAIGETDVKVTDLYFKKGFGNLSLALEVPILSGELGNAFNSTQEAKYKAKAIIFKGSFQANESWAFGVDAGTVSGESGDTSSYDAMYLNPNYQVAKLLFRYNRRAIGAANRNVYDSYITNAMFAKLGLDYSSESWLFKSAFIWAVAKETATAGGNAFNHTSNQAFSAVTNQDDQLGYEIDLSIDYKWNNEITVGSSAAYLLTGEYWAYTNSTTQTNKAENSFLLQLRTSIDF